jgi:hypothetical protein|nr:IS256 family transposase [Ligilactobacillus ruminis]
MVNKDIIEALSSDKDIILNEVLRRQIEVAANQFLQNELTAVLGYEPHTRIDRSKDDVNYRNGAYTRTIDTEYGEINLTIPRDRLNKFQNALFPPYVRRTDGLEEMVIKMYSKGVTTREIADMVERMYDHCYSPTTVSNITKRTEHLVEKLHERKFKHLQYVCVFLDATYIPLRRGTVEREAVNVAIGIRSDGGKEVFDYSIAPTENGSVWSELLQGLLARGIKDIQLFIADGLVGLQSAIEANYPQAKFQRCWVHAERNLLGTETIRGEYGLQLGKLSDRRRNLKFYSESDAWDDFQKQPVKYNNTVEKLVPGLLGNGDSMYGLPKELAGKIQDEDFFPDGLRCELRRYQELGVKYILHQGRVLLGDEMGLGKTVQAIASMVSLRNTGSTHFVVVCPASVMINWCREIERFSLLSVIKVHGTTKQAAIREWLDKGGVAVTTYETTSAFSLPDDFRFGMLVVDEAHYIKNPSAKRSVSVMKLSEHADRMLFMTGTPIENNVDEMIRLISILQPKIARKVSNIKSLSFASQFREKIAPVYYRRKREDVLTELPELVESREWCRLGKVEREAYEQAVLKKSYNDARRVSWSVDDLKYSSKAGRMMEIIADAKADGRKDTASPISETQSARCDARQPVHRAD